MGQPTRLSSYSTQLPRGEASRLPRIQWGRLALRAGTVATLGGATWAGVADTDWEPRLLRQARWNANVVMRNTRALCTMATIAADYKYTWWRYNEETDPELFKEKTAEVHQRSADRMLWLCFQNKGLYIKVGQYLSTLHHAIPHEYLQTLKVLQDHAPTMDYTIVQRIIEEDLGAKPEQLFREFDKIPLAAASLAQVHHAVAHDGRELAVKIQYPTLRDEFSGDMFTHWLVLNMADMLFDHFDLAWMHDELEQNLVKELDFENEARNSERCAHNFRGKTNIYVPKVEWPLTTKRVLTMEFIHGLKINDTNGLKKQGIDVKDAAGLAIEALAEQIYLHGFVHCDPHPGNIFVRWVDHGKVEQERHGGVWDALRSFVQLFWKRSETKSRELQVVLLDHGLYREMEEEVRINYCQLWKNLIIRDDDKVKEYCKKLGVDDDWDMFSLIVLMRPYNHSTLPGVQGLAQLDLERVRAEFQAKIKVMMTLMRQMPRELLLVFRNQNYLRALNKELGDPVNRFTIMARVAVKGISHVPDAVHIHSPNELVDTQLRQLDAHGLHEQWLLIKELRNKVSFELHLQLNEWIYWLAKVWFLLLGVSVEDELLDKEF